MRRLSVEVAHLQVVQVMADADNVDVGLRDFTQSQSTALEQAEHAKNHEVCC